MPNSENKQKPCNYAFIDSQNLYLSINSQGWKLDYQKFRVYLKDKYNVEKAYLFIGFIPENQDIYNFLQSNGYVLIFKEVLKLKDSSNKGNVDAELVLQAMVDYDEYDKAIIVSGDGDFACLIKHLYKKSKLEMVLVPNHKRYSILIKKTAKEKLDHISFLKDKLQLQKKNGTDKD